ncbi:ABC transporter substrate-binding protein [Catellatospora coxensis]
MSLRMTVWSSNEAHLKLFNEIADAYQAKNPRVTEVKFDPIPFESYTTTLTTQIAGGNGPDLAWLLENSAPDFVGSGALLPLDDTLAKADGYNAADLSPAATKLWQAGGKLFAYPSRPRPSACSSTSTSSRPPGSRLRPS